MINWLKRLVDVMDAFEDVDSMTAYSDGWKIEVATYRYKEPNERVLTISRELDGKVKELKDEGCD